jgi:nucleotide-binding universal stress UspA family protein
MRDASSRPVVAGVDHSPDSAAAIAYAAWEARRRGAALRLVHGFQVPVSAVGTPVPFVDDSILIAAARAHIEQLAASLRPDYPDLRITSAVVAGSGGYALVSESAGAQLVVVGPRGTGGFHNLLLGSVTAQVIAHAGCPVIVVRRRSAGGGGGPVVVGIDGSPMSEDVVGFALDEAAARGASLVSVFVWSVPQMYGLSTGTVWSQNPVTAQAQLQEAAERVCAEVLAGWAQKYPQVPMKRWTVHGDDPARTLLQVADQVLADLVVVGSRGFGALGTALHGSVSRKVSDHAPVSVAVVHSLSGPS